jgi:hypothetical protein
MGVDQFLNGNAVCALPGSDLYKRLMNKIFVRITRHDPCLIGPFGVEII